MMMKLTQSQLENIIKSKVINKIKYYQYKLKQCKVDPKFSVPGSLQNFSPNPGTFQISITIVPFPFMVAGTI